MLTVFHILIPGSTRAQYSDGNVYVISYLLLCILHHKQAEYTICQSCSRDRIQIHNTSLHKQIKMMYLNNIYVYKYSWMDGVKYSLAMTLYLVSVSHREWIDITIVLFSSCILFIQPKENTQVISIKAERCTTFLVCTLFIIILI